MGSFVFYLSILSLNSQFSMSTYLTIFQLFQIRTQGQTKDVLCLKKKGKKLIKRKIAWQRHLKSCKIKVLVQMSVEAILTFVVVQPCSCCLSIVYISQGSCKYKEFIQPGSTCEKLLINLVVPVDLMT